jgi:hypothetical protein
MTEEELINLGFEKQIITDAESQNGYDYYYYLLELTKNFILFSSGDDEVENYNDWTVFNDDMDFVIKDETLLKKLIYVFREIKT